MGGTIHCKMTRVEDVSLGQDRMDLAEGVQGAGTPSLTLSLKPLSSNWHLGDGVTTFVHHLPGFLPS